MLLYYNEVSPKFYTTVFPLAHYTTLYDKEKIFLNFFRLQCRLQEIFNRNRINSLGAEVLITFHQNYYLFLLLTIIYFLCC